MQPCFLQRIHLVGIRGNVPGMSLLSYAPIPGRQDQHPFAPSTNPLPSPTDDRLAIRSSAVVHRVRCVDVARRKKSCHFRRCFLAVADSATISRGRMHCGPKSRTGWTRLRSPRDASAATSHNVGSTYEHVEGAVDDYGRHVRIASPSRHWGSRGTLDTLPASATARPI